jgi:Protein of unknown function (DUF2793)
LEKYMADASARLNLPLLAAGQAQKEITHNEALSRLDGLVQMSIEARNLPVPPVAPVIGHCWIVPVGASGVWSGHAQEIAHWTSGGWRFSVPLPGFIAWSKADSVFGWFDGSAWNWNAWPVGGLRIGGAPMLVSARPAISTPVGGATVDVQSRDAVTAILSALRSHGLIQV